MVALPSHMAALGMSWDTPIYQGALFDDRLRFSSKVDGAFAVPYFFMADGTPDTGSLALLNAQLYSTFTNRVDVDVTDGLTLSASHTARVDVPLIVTDYLMARRPIAPPISNFATAGVTYSPSQNFGLGASVYMPISIFDTRYSEDFLWSASAQAKLSKDVSLSASVTGDFINPQPVETVSLGLQLGAFDVSAYGRQLNSGMPDMGLRLSVDAVKLAEHLRSK
jgi:hypothetical protein